MAALSVDGTPMPALPNRADQINYDNTTSGLSATTVKGAVDELASEKQDATDNNLTTTNKTIVGGINELKSGLTDLSEEVNGDATTYPYADVITIPDAVPSNLADCKVKIEPVQDLHGYDKPWVGGAGKNKVNPAGWTNFTNNGITYIVDKDNGEITVSNTATANSSSDYDLSNLLPNTQYILTGAPSTSSESSTYNLQVQPLGVKDIGNGVTFTTGNDVSNYKLRITVYNGVSGNNAVFKPMVRLATETDATWAPYENICPISGHTEASVQRDGKNILNPATFSHTNPNTGTTDNSWAVWTYNRCEEGKAYTLDCNIELNTIYSYFVNFYDKYFNFISQTYGNYVNPNNLGFTTPTGTAYVKIMFYHSSSLESYNFTKAQLMEGSAVDEIVPYIGETYTIALGDTIYGGTVRIDSNGNTVMDVDSGILDLDTASVNYGGQLGAFVVADTGKKSGIIGLLTNKLNIITTSFSWGDYGDYPDMSVGQSGGNTNFYFKVLSATDSVSDFKTAMSDVQVVYELATPFTVQLTPQQIKLLKGVNTISASTGQISVTVNGVSGSIGQVQEQVNDHEERIEAVESLSKHYTFASSIFNWDSAEKCFIANIDFGTTIPDYHNLVGIVANATNGAAIMGAYYNATSKLLRVFGWLPSSGESIDNAYNFICCVFYT